MSNEQEKGQSRSSGEKLAANQQENLDGKTIEEKPKNKNPLNEKKVVIGMTGGFDSTAAAFLLKKQGFECIGLSLQLMESEIILPKDKTNETGSKNENEQDNGVLAFDSCTSKNLETIKEICDQLDITFFAVNARKEYEAMILDPLVESFLVGESYNPCVNCNKLKIKILMEKADLLGAKYVATGHYAKIHKNLKTNEHQVYMANDIDNDQSFYLSKLEQSYLQRLLLPLGEIRKSEVRKIMVTFGYSLKERRDAKKFCLVQDEATKYLIERRAHEKFRSKGYFFDETDMQLAEHKGIYAYHIGQKLEEEDFAGAPVSEKNLYIVSMDPTSSRIVLGPKERLMFAGCGLNNLILRRDLDTSKPLHVFVQFDLNKDKISAFLFFKNNNAGILEFKEAIWGLRKGDFLAFFNKKGAGAALIGGGTIDYLGSLDPVRRTPIPLEEQNQQHEDEEEGSPPKVIKVKEFLF